jgi:hypothetical protein
VVLSKRERYGLLGIVLFAVATAAVSCEYLQSAWGLATAPLMAAVMGLAMWAARWTAQPERPDRFSVGMFLFFSWLAGVAAHGLVGAILFGANAVPGTARVEDVTSYLGRWDARVVHEVDGKPVQADLRTAFHSVEKGTDLPILFLPNEPTRVRLDSIWQRYLILVVLLGFGVPALWELRLFYSVRKTTGEASKNGGSMNPA